MYRQETQRTYKDFFSVGTSGISYFWFDCKQVDLILCFEQWFQIMIIFRFLFFFKIFFRFCWYRYILFWYQIMRHFSLKRGTPHLVLLRIGRGVYEITWNSIAILAAGGKMPIRCPVGLETSPPKGDTRGSAVWSRSSPGISQAVSSDGSSAW